MVILDVLRRMIIFDDCARGFGFVVSDEQI
jgi:hypothetical protein